MKTNDRIEAILEILQNQKFSSVSELSQKLFSSPSSIRRTLVSMEQSGLVTRNYGGVLLRDNNSSAPPFHVRCEKNHHLKRAIASDAASLLCDGQTVLLDDSTTSFYLLEHIARHRGITIFTNNLYTVARAVELSINAYALGGRSLMGEAVCYGNYALEMLDKIYADIFFFSAFSLSESGDISDCTEETVSIRAKMLSHASKKVFLCDSSKFGSRSAHYLCNIRNADVIFSDSELPCTVSEQMK